MTAVRVPGRAARSAAYSDWAMPTGAVYLRVGPLEGQQVGVDAGHDDRDPLGRGRGRRRPRRPGPRPTGRRRGSAGPGAAATRSGASGGRPRCWPVGESRSSCMRCSLDRRAPARARCGWRGSAGRPARRSCCRPPAGTGRRGRRAAPAVSEAKKRASRRGRRVRVRQRRARRGGRAPRRRARRRAGAAAPCWWRTAVQPVVASITNTTARASSARQR